MKKSFLKMRLLYF